MRALPADALPAAPVRRHWHARLALSVAVRDGRSVLRHCVHEGPLRIQKVLYPQGPKPAQLLLLHPPGGIAGGDALQIALEVGRGAHALLTTPGAGKWYKAAGGGARQDVALRVDAGAALEWLPQESIVFDRAQAAQTLRIDCAGDARCCGWDIVVLGRRASAERFAHGRWSQRIDIVRDGRLLWAERSRIDGSDPLLQSVVGWNGLHVSGLLWALGGPFDDGLLAACRAIPAAPPLRLGCTQPLPGLLLVRVLGDCAERVRAALTAVWAQLRPALFGLPALTPRIWST